MVYEWHLTDFVSEYDTYTSIHSYGYSYSYGEAESSLGLHGLHSLNTALATATANSDSKVSHVFLLISPPIHHVR